MTPKRYHTALITLHWLLALLMLVELGLGSTFLKYTPNDVPEKLLALRNHIVAGNLILIFTVIRLVVRLKTKHPSSVTGGNIFLGKLATFAHYGLYLLIMLMATSGLVLAAQSNLPAVVFEGIGNLPANFSEYDARIAHGIIAKLLIMLILGHILAALYHQFIRKDALLDRMWFGKK